MDPIPLMALILRNIGLACALSMRFIAASTILCSWSRAATTNRFARLKTNVDTWYGRKCTQRRHISELPSSTLANPIPAFFEATSSFNRLPLLTNCTLWSTNLCDDRCSRKHVTERADS